MEVKPGGLNACACAAVKTKAEKSSNRKPHLPANNEEIYLNIATIKAPSDSALFLYKILYSTFLTS